MATPRELDAMRRAIALSAYGLGTTSPNPPVGCVILDADGRIAGEGFHRHKGEPHAEGHALHAAGSRAKGAAAVVTLEPCNHIGRTPACRQLLLDAGVRRVLIAVMDPTSRGEGGAAALRQAGVEIETDVLADEARLVLGTWLAAFKLKRPVVTWVYASQGNGIAAPSESLLAQLRSQTDAVLGADRTVQEGVLGSHGRDILQLPAEPLPADPYAVLSTLYAGGVRSLLLVGNAAAEPFIAAGQIDRVVAYLGRPDGLSSASAASPWALAPKGFRVTGIGRSGDGLWVECQRGFIVSDATRPR